MPAENMTISLTDPFTYDYLTCKHSNTTLSGQIDLLINGSGNLADV